MKRLLTGICALALALAALGASFPYVTLNNKTNRLSDNGTNFTRNGVAIGGGDTIWTNDITQESNYITPANSQATVYIPNPYGYTNGVRTVWVATPDNDDWDNVGYSYLETASTHAKHLIEADSVSGNSMTWNVRVTSTNLLADVFDQDGFIVEWRLLTSGASTNSAAFRFGTPVKYSNSLFEWYNGYTDFGTNLVAKINANGSISTGSNTNRWIFKTVTEGATTNIVVNINGKDYTFQAW